MFKIIKQFIKFGLIGALNTVINYGISTGIYYLVLTPNGWTNFWLAGNLIAFAICTLIAYYLQTKFVFDQKGQSTSRVLLKSYTVYGFSNAVMENVILWLARDVLGLPFFLAKFIPMFFTIPTNFILHKFWVYKESVKNEQS